VEWLRGDERGPRNFLPSCLSLTFERCGSVWSYGSVLRTMERHYWFGGPAVSVRRLFLLIITVLLQSVNPTPSLAAYDSPQLKGTQSKQSWSSCGTFSAINKAPRSPRVETWHLHGEANTHALAQYATISHMVPGSPAQIFGFRRQIFGPWAEKKTGCSSDVSHSAMDAA